MSNSTLRTIFCGVLLLSCLGTLSCNPGTSGGDALAVRARLIDQAAPRLDTSQFHGAQKAVWSMDMTKLDPWEVRQGEAEILPKGGIRLVPSGKTLRLVGTMNIQATEFDSFSVIMDRQFTGSVKIYWSAAGDIFSEERQVTARVRNKATVKVPMLHQAWAGSIERLRLDIGIQNHDELVLKGLRGLGIELDQEKLAAAIPTAWRVDLNDEIRPAMLALPGLERTWEVEVPEGNAELRFSFAAEHHLVEPVTLQVTVDGEPLSSLTIGDESLTFGRWHEHSIDLGTHAGNAVTLAFTAEADIVPEDLRGLSFLGDPQILGPMEERPPNVILISVDTLRSDRLSLYGHTRNTSPNLDAWAKRRAVTFKTAVAPSPWTLPSHITMFTGFDPLSHGLNFGDVVPQDLVLLARRLRDAGYSTRAITGGGYLSGHYGLDQGFDVYKYWSPSAAGGKLEELERGMNDAVDFLSETPTEPFMLFFHTYEVHSPYNPRQPYFDQFVGDALDSGDPDLPVIRVGTTSIEADPEMGYQINKQLIEAGGERQALGEEWFPRVGDLYDSGISFMDAQMERLFTALKEKGLEDNTLIVLTSDHGEALGEHGHAGHAYLYDFNILVPMIVAFPGGRGAGTVFEQQVRVVDVTPTILDVVGLQIPSGLDGVSLQPAADGEKDFVPREAWSYASSSNRGLSLRLGNRLKMIFNNTPFEPVHGNPKLFNVADDPGEFNNLAEEATESEQFRRRIAERYANEIRALRCELTNPSEAPIPFEAIGKPLVSPLRIKALDIDNAQLEWDGRSLQGKVPAEGTTQLFFEGFGNESMRWRLEGSSLYLPLEISSLAGEWRAVRRNGQWAMADAEGNANAETSEPEVRCRWQGPLYGGDAAPDELDPELLQRLRDLGYLN